jgi:hypothetical protein
LTNPEIALSTSDNPYNPLTEFDEWDAYDRQQGYNTSAYLDRVLKTTLEFGEEVYNQDLERAIDEIVVLNLISWMYDGVSYIKVVGKAPEPED